MKSNTSKENNNIPHGCGMPAGKVKQMAIFASDRLIRRGGRECHCQAQVSSNLYFQDSFQLIKHRKPSFIALYAVLVIISLITVTISLVHLLSRATIFPSCEKPAIRREWRSLTRSEKQDFTQAAICLASIPSTWQPNGTIYDDFAILHGGIGSWCAF